MSSVTKNLVLELIMIEISNSRAHRGRVMPIGDVRSYIQSLLDDFEQHVIEQNKVTEIIATKTTVES